MNATAVAVVGAGATGRCVAEGLLDADISDFVVLEQKDDGRLWPSVLQGRLRLRCEITSSVFDDNTASWTLTTRGGETHHSRVVIAAHQPMYVPWIPKLAGSNEFRGASFHSASYDRDFDPTGKRIAVIGGDSASGHLIDRFTASAASIKIFAHPPRRIVPVISTRPIRVMQRLLGLMPGTAPDVTPLLVRSSVDAVTGSGVRTRDGRHHDVDAIVYGTGFTIPEGRAGHPLVGAGGLTIEQAWQDGMEPYCGVAVYGFPNYLLANGPDRAAQASYVVECLKLMQQSAGTRIEVRRSSQQVFNERVHLRRPLRRLTSSVFDLSDQKFAVDHIYDGDATLTMADVSRQVRVRLTGHVDPIDGRYHWQGTLFDSLPADILNRTRTIALAVGERSAAARITEQTCWGTYSIAGVGLPPYPLDGVSPLPSAAGKDYAGLTF